MNWLDVFNNYTCTVWDWFSLPCSILFAIALGVVFLMLLAIVHILWDLIESLFHRKGLKNHTRSFSLKITRAKFEEELNEFINPKDDDILLPPSMLEWRILERRKTDSEIKRDGLFNKKIITHDIDFADSIRLVNSQYHGLIIEMESKPKGLLVSVHPEGEQRSNAELVESKIKKGRKTIKHTGYQHTGYTPIPVNEKAHLELLKWLDNLERTQNDQT